MKNSNLDDAPAAAETQTETKEKNRANLRPLALNNPIDSKLTPPPFIAEIHRRVTTRPLTVCATLEGELIERGCALISLLIMEGGASVASPVKLIKQLRINPDEAQYGYIRWSAETRNKKIGRLAGQKADYAQGPRQFLYSHCHCSLLAILHFRIKRMKAKIGDALLPPVNRDLLAVARRDLPWLKSVRGKVTWSGVFRAWQENLLADFDFNQKKIAGTITEGALWQLYRWEPPLLIGARRGSIVVAPLPDKQFLNFLPAMPSSNALAKTKNKISDSVVVEEFFGNPDSMTFDANFGNDSAEDERAAERKEASSEIRSFLGRIIERETSYSEAAAEARETLKMDVFKTQSTEDYYYLLKWLNAKFDFGSGKRNRVTSLHTYAKRLLRLINAFPDTRFAEITLDDMVLFLSQYSTSNAAKFYRAVAANFHKFLRDVEEIMVAEIDWKSQRLQFYAGYREQGIITEAQFQSALKNVGASSRLSSQQMRIILLLLRRLGLRCAEVAWLKLSDFDGITECRLIIEHSKTAAGRRALPINLLLSDDEQAELFEFLDERRKVLCERNQATAPLFELADGSAVEPAQIGAEVTNDAGSGIKKWLVERLRNALKSHALR